MFEPRYPLRMRGKRANDEKSREMSGRKCASKYLLGRVLFSPFTDNFFFTITGLEDTTSYRLYTLIRAIKVYLVSLLALN